MMPIENDPKVGLNETNEEISNAASLGLNPGDIILDRYRVIRLLGRGGMGSVYEVEHINLHGRYALKFLNKNQAADADWRRFENEARASNKLEHPNLIKVHDFGILPSGPPYFIMDLVEGETLADLLKRQGRLPVDQTIKLFIQVGFALIYAHSNGIVHRDIKPSNIILSKANSGKTEDSVVKLVDFGIAKLTGQDGFNQQTLTQTGEIFGSPLYMSPEQCLGIAVDHRTDLYSLGCVMFETLTGAPPHVGDSALSTMMKHQTEEPLPLREASLGVEFPLRIEQVVRRLLAKDLTERYQSAELFTADLVGMDTNENLTAERSPPAGSSNLDTLGLSKPVMCFIAICIFTFGTLFGYTVPVDVTQLLPAYRDKWQRHMPPESVISENPLVSESTAQTRINQDFLKEAKKTTPFSEILPNQARIFNFPNFNIGMYFAPGTAETAPPWTVHNFRGIYFRPNINFRKHPQLFLRFREDDIRTLNVSNARTFVNLVADKLSDADELLPFITHLRSLEFLILADSEISSKGMTCIGQLPNLKALSLERSTVKGSDIAKLPQLKKIETLCVYSLKDSDPLVQALCRFNSIKRLRLINCDINPEQLEKIAKLTKLTELDISKNPKISDKEMALLPIQLTELALIGCPVTSNSTKQLARLKQLRFLYLDETLWTAEQLRTLQTLLPKTAIQLTKEKKRHNTRPNPNDMDQDF